MRTRLEEITSLECTPLSARLITMGVQGKLGQLMAYSPALTAGFNDDDDGAADHNCARVSVFVCVVQFIDVV